MTFSNDEARANRQPLYFAEAETLQLTTDQAKLLASIRRCVADPAMSCLLPEGTLAELDDSGRLLLKIKNSRDPRVGVEIYVDQDDEISVVSEAMHPGFWLMFNSKWEPDDSLGDLDDAAEAICGLLHGRLESEVLWGGNVIARSKDVLVTEAGQRKVLATRCHADGLLACLTGRRREVRRLTFS